MNGPRFVPGRDLCNQILTSRPNPAVMASIEPVEQPPADDKAASPVLYCDQGCDDGCSMTEFPVWMRPYRCRHLSADDRRVRDIVFAEARDGTGRDNTDGPS